MKVIFSILFSLFLAVISSFFGPSKMARADGSADAVSIDFPTKYAPREVPVAADGTLFPNRSHSNNCLIERCRIRSRATATDIVTTPQGPTKMTLALPSLQPTSLNTRNILPARVCMQSYPKPVNSDRPVIGQLAHDIGQHQSKDASA